MFYSDEHKEHILSQLLEVRNSGRVNMMGMNAVQRAAYEMGLMELVNFLDTVDRSDYGRLITEEFVDYVTENT